LNPEVNRVCRTLYWAGDIVTRMVRNRLFASA
jgi:hypothetical protein